MRIKNKRKRQAVALILALTMILMLVPSENKRIQAANETTAKATFDVLAMMPDTLMSVEAFDTFTLTAEISSKDKSTVAMKVDFTLSNTYLAKQSDLAETLGVDSLQNLTFDIPIAVDEDIVKLIDSPLLQDKELTVNEDQVIGHYSYTAIDSENLKITGTVSVSDIVKNEMNNVRGTFSNSFHLDNSNDFGAEPSMKKEDTKIALTVKLDDPADDPGANPEDYKIVKTLQSRDKTSPYIDYRIEVTAENGSVLNTLTIEDVLPEGLELVEYRIDGRVYYQEDVHYNRTTRIFSYEVPEYDKEIDATKRNSVDIELCAKVTKDEYVDFLSNLDKTKTYSNTATLARRDGTVVKKSNEVSTSLQGDFMTKKGELVGNNGKTYKWTIQANTYFEGGRVYLIDKIEGIDKTHMYVKGDGNAVSYKINGTDGQACYSDNAGLKAIRYGDATNFTAKNIKNKILAAGIADDTSVYYTYDSDEDGTDDTAILVVPLQAPQLNSPITMTYETKIVDAYDTTAENQAELENMVTMLWNWENEDDGPLPWSPNFDFEITKSVDPNITLVEKRAGTYNSSTQEMLWNVDVNHRGLPLDDVILTDKIDTKCQQFVQVTLDGTVLQSYDETGGTTPYYQKTGTDGNQVETYEIHLGDIEQDKLELLQIKTKVVDPNVLAKQGNNVGTIENEILLSANAGGYSDSSRATKTVKNTLIKKEALKANSTTVGSEYDYYNHRMHWRITVNPDHVPMKNGVLKDTLPVGNYMQHSDEIKVNRISKSGSTTGPFFACKGDFATGMTSLEVGTGEEIQFSYIEADVLDPSSRDEWSVNLGSIHDHDGVDYTTDSFVFDFYTTVSQEYRDKNFMDVNKTHEFANICELSGYVLHPEEGSSGEVTGVAITDATASATQKVKVPSIVKKGVFYASKEDACCIEWTIWLNPDKVNMCGATLKDKLKSHYELKDNKIDIYKATVSADGSLQQQEVATSIAVDQEEDEFSFKIPDEYKRTPLIVSFTTLVTASATANDMSNSAVLSWEDGAEIATGEQKASNAAAFDENAFMSANKVPNLTVYVAEGGTTYQGEVPSDVLSDAELMFSAMTEDGGNLVSVPTTAKEKTTTTTGKVKFTYLQRDTLYQVQEMTAPEDYKIDDTKYYVVFLKDKSASDFPAGTKVYSATDYQGTLTIENFKYRDLLPDVTFTKKSDYDKTLSGARFSLNNDTTASTPIYADSDENGKVTFENVAEGTYTIKEETAPDGYEQAEDISCTVAFTGTAYTVELTGASLKKDTESGECSVIDVAKRMTPKVVLKDLNENPVVGQDKFEVYTADETQTKVAYLEPDTTGVYKLSPGEEVVDPDKGPYVKQVGEEYALLEGDYIFKSTKSIPGYRDDTTAHPLNVTNAAQEITVYRTPVGSIVGKTVTDRNEPLVGVRIGLFPEGTTEFKTENLYLDTTVISGSDGAFTFSDVPYGTYVVAELSVPIEYRLNTTTAYTVVINNNTKVVEEDINGSKVSIANTPLSRLDNKADLLIVLTSQDDVVEGMRFTITSESGYENECVTDAAGEILLQDLPLDRYTISEVATEQMTEKYILPGDETVELTEDNAKVAFHNELKPTPAPTPVPTMAPMPTSTPSTVVENQNQVPTPAPTTATVSASSTPEPSVVPTTVPDNSDSKDSSGIPKTSYEVNDGLLKILLGISILCCGICVGVVSFVAFRVRKLKKNKVR